MASSASVVSPLSHPLRARIIEVDAPQSVSALADLEELPRRSDCSEWVATIFLHADVAAMTFRDAKLAAPLFEMTCRSRAGRGRSIGTEFEAGLRRAAAAVLACTTTAMENRLTKLLDEVKKALPHGERISMGCDVTIRRTVGEHGTAAPWEKHDPSSIHADSWDGTILAFGLTCTKLGTPVYPAANFPLPVATFLAQSRSGRSIALQLQDDAGPRRPWKPGSLVVMPACTAHSKPDPLLETDPSPNIARWFSRANIRVALRRRDPTPAGRKKRVAIALLVAEILWGDSRFAAAAKCVAEANDAQLKAWESAEAAATARRSLEVAAGAYSGNVRASDMARHGKGKCIYANGAIYEGEWKNNLKHGMGEMQYPNGRMYTGEWKNNLKHGKGTYVFENGEKYTGIFCQGKPLDQEACAAARDAVNRSC